MPSTDDLETKLNNLIELAVQMRRAQRYYFKTRDHVALIDCKTLEKLFDAMLAELQNRTLV